MKASTVYIAGEYYQLTGDPTTELPKETFRTLKTILTQLRDCVRLTIDGWEPSVVEKLKFMRYTIARLRTEIINEYAIASNTIRFMNSSVCFCPECCNQN